MTESILAPECNSLNTGETKCYDANNNNVVVEETGGTVRGSLCWKGECDFCCSHRPFSGCSSDKAVSGSSLEEYSCESWTFFLCLREQMTQRVALSCTRRHSAVQ